MARPGTLFTDFRHLPEDIDIEGRSLAAFLAGIVGAASLEGPEAHIRLPLRCRRRPKRRACPGEICVDRHRKYSEIEWHCSECDFNGIITHWEDSGWDLAKPRPEQPVKVSAPELPPNQVRAALAGRWRIVEMEVWDADAIDLLGPANIEFTRDGGALQFIAVQGGLDCRYGEVDGRALVEFSWVGADDRDSACGRGWARLQPDGTLSGRIFIHCGDDSAFIAARFEQPPLRASRGRGVH